MATIRLTAAQALVRWLGAQFVEAGGDAQPYFGGVWAIFGHGNVAGIGERVRQRIDQLLGPGDTVEPARDRTEAIVG